MFEPNSCLIYDAHGSIVLIGKRVNHIYIYLTCIMHHLASIVFLQKRMILGYGIEDFVTHTCSISIGWIENRWLKDYQNSSLRRIE